MPISHKHKIIFIHIPKCAGSSIESILDIKGVNDFYTKGMNYYREQIIPKDKFSLDDYKICLSKNMQHYTFLELSKILDNEILKTYKIITVVRNPFDRLVSEYNFIMNSKLKDKPTFKELILYKLNLDPLTRNTCFDGHLETQTSYLINEQNNFNNINKIYKFENLQECLKEINQMTGNNSYPHLLSSLRTKPFMEYYDDQLKQIVYNFYKQDFINFNYYV